MKILLLLLAMLGLSGPAYAFKSCTQTTLSSGTAALPAEQSDPVIAGNNLYVAYTDSTGLVLRVSNDGGTSWSATILDPAGRLPRIAATGQQVYVAWFTGTSGAWSVGFAGSQDAGATFTTSNLGATFLVDLVEDRELQIGASNAVVAVIYANPNGTDMEVAASADQGQTFTYSDLPSLTQPVEEYIAVYGPDIAVVWEDTGADSFEKILFAYSTNSGQSFSAPLNLTADQVDEREPVAVFSQNTGALYLIRREGHTDAGLTVGVLSKSTDFGATWSASQLINPGAQRARQFSLVAVDPVVYVSYLRHRAPDDWWTQLIVSQDGGATFGPPVSLGNTGLHGELTDEFHAPRIWAEQNLFRIVYDVQGTLNVRASAGARFHLAGAVALGKGAQALIARNAVMWLTSGNAAIYANCQ